MTNFNKAKFLANPKNKTPAALEYRRLQMREQQAVDTGRAGGFPVNPELPQSEINQLRGDAERKVSANARVEFHNDRTSELGLEKIVFSAFVRFTGPDGFTFEEHMGLLVFDRETGEFEGWSQGPS